MTTADVNRKLTVDESENLPRIPHGATLLCAPIDPGRVRPGQFVLVRGPKGTSVRRVARKEWRGSDLQIWVKRESANNCQPVDPAAIEGVVRAASYRGARFDPSDESPLTRFLHSLTDYGTTSAMRKILRAMTPTTPAPKGS